MLLSGETLRMGTAGQQVPSCVPAVGAVSSVLLSAHMGKTEKKRLLIAVYLSAKSGARICLAPLFEINIAGPYVSDFSR